MRTCEFFVSNNHKCEYIQSMNQKLGTKKQNQNLLHTKNTIHYPSRQNFDTYTVVHADCVSRFRTGRSPHYPVVSGGGGDGVCGVHAFSRCCYRRSSHSEVNTRVGALEKIRETITILTKFSEIRICRGRFGFWQKGPGCARMLNHYYRAIIPILNHQEIENEISKIARKFFLNHGDRSIISSRKW